MCSILYDSYKTFVSCLNSVKHTSFTNHNNASHKIITHLLMTLKLQTAYSACNLILVFEVFNAMVSILFIVSFFFFLLPIYFSYNAKTSCLDITNRICTIQYFIVKSNYVNFQITAISQITPSLL